VALLNKAELTELLQTQVNVEINEIIIDSRLAKKGTMFFGISGENHNGGDFADSAIALGAELVVIDHKAKCESKNGVVRVDDPLYVLNQFAQYSRRRTKAKVIGVTGSVGKTTTKEMLKAAFASVGTVYASSGNFNNHFGLPLCLANLPQDVDFAIFEMGMSASGEIERLTKLAKPDLAIVTNVAAVHLEFFKSVDEIAKAKAEIFAGATSVAVINFDDEHRKVQEAEALAHNLKVVGFGVDPHAQYRLLNYEVKDGYGVISAAINGKEYEYTLGIIGIHHAKNSLSVIAAVNELTHKLPLAVFADFHAQEGRGKIKVLGNNITIIDDAYNASPIAVKASIENLNFIVGGRRMVVLGDMRELGEEGPKLHQSLLEPLLSAQVEKVFLVGKLMRSLWDVLPANIKGQHTATADEMTEFVLNELQANDVVLCKGSNSMKIYNIVKAIEARH
jgi:UDP-N-acetylmuramoyl-tripeptide--D-alanyl-D-alanine ligase